MAEKVLFFTAGPVTTVEENQQIDAWTAAYASPGAVLVRNKLANPNYGHGKEEADIVTGSPPVAYNGTPHADADAPPTFVKIDLEGALAVEVTGDVTGSYDVAFIIEDGVIVGMTMTETA